MSISSLSLHQRHILEQIGLTLDGNGYAVLTDYQAAGMFNHHRTFMPIAAAAWTLSAPGFAESQLRGYRLVDFIRIMPFTSEGTTDLVAMALRIETRGPYNWRDNRCYRHLLDLMDRYDLGDFFAEYPEEGPGFLAIRPHGATGTGPNESSDQRLAAFRRAFKKLPAARQMLVASLIWFFRGPFNDSPWLKGTKRDWPITEALEVLDDADMLQDWSKLAVLCPGW